VIQFDAAALTRLKADVIEIASALRRASTTGNESNMVRF
jgi:hypothetical protein